MYETYMEVSAIPVSKNLFAENETSNLWKEYQLAPKKILPKLMEEMQAKIIKKKGLEYRHESID